jgi:hypothetical protein
MISRANSPRVNRRNWKRYKKLCRNNRRQKLQSTEYPGTLKLEGLNKSKVYGVYETS